MAINTKQKENQRKSRHLRIRKRLAGTTERPRLCLHRSLKNLSAQVIDDTQHKIIFGLSTLSKSIREQIKDGGNVKGAALFGQAVAAYAKQKGISKVSFDRGGCLYHGRVKAFADAARKGGLEF